MTNTNTDTDQNNVKVDCQQRRCDRVGNFAQCELPFGHPGVIHRNVLEEFIQIDILPK